MVWQIFDPKDVLFGWLSREPDPELREHVMAWVGTSLAGNPEDVESFPVPGARPRTVAAFVPGTDVVVAYLMVDQYRSIRLMSVGSLRDLLPPAEPPGS